MTKDRWLEIKDLIKEKFAVENEGLDTYEEHGGLTVEWLEFAGPLGMMRLEYESSPLILDKKTHGSNRIGTQAAVEYVYSDTERTAKFYAYKYSESDDAWIDIDLNTLNFA